MGEVRLPGEVHRQGSAAELQTPLQAAPLTLSPSAATTSPRHSLTVTWPSFCWVGVDELCTEDPKRRSVLVS